MVNQVNKNVLQEHDYRAFVEVLTAIYKHSFYKKKPFSIEFIIGHWVSKAAGSNYRSDYVSYISDNTLYPKKAPIRWSDKELLLQIILYMTQWENGRCHFVDRREIQASLSGKWKV